MSIMKLMAELGWWTGEEAYLRWTVGEGRGWGAPDLLSPEGWEKIHTKSPAQALVSE